MDSRGLLIAVRHNNVNLVSRLISEGVDINGLSQVEPFVPRPQELPLYDSFPLFEACRSRNFDMIQLLLQFPEINVNARATRLQVTPFCDACARGDTMIASLLLSDPRVDGRIGSTVVSRPVLYACMTGALQLLKLCAEHGLLDDEAESSAVSTARANGHQEASKFIYEHYVDARPLTSLSPVDRISKVRREFFRFAPSGRLEAGKLGALAAALGTPLSPHEEVEALAALNSSATFHIESDAFSLYWLGSIRLAKGLSSLHSII